MHYSGGLTAKYCVVRQKRYVDNFLAVTRARAEEEKKGHSDDDFSDEELLVGKHTFADIVKTRMGRGSALVRRPTSRMV